MCDRHLIGTMEVNDTVIADLIDGELAEAGVADRADIEVVEPALEIADPNPPAGR